MYKSLLGIALIASACLSCPEPAMATGVAELNQLIDSAVDEAMAEYEPNPELTDAQNEAEYLSARKEFRREIEAEILKRLAAQEKSQPSEQRPQLACNDERAKQHIHHMVLRDLRKYTDAPLYAEVAAHLGESGVVKVKTVALDPQEGSIRCRAVFQYDYKNKPYETKFDYRMESYEDSDRIDMAFDSKAICFHIALKADLMRER